MKKTITFFVFIAFVATVQAQKLPKNETKTAIAVYDGFSDDAFYFTNTLDNSSIIFQKVKDNILKQYDLNRKDYLKEAFRITYSIKYEKTLPQSTKPMVAIRTILDMEHLENYNDSPQVDDGE